MLTKIIVDITQTIGDKLKFKGAFLKKEFKSDKIIGTTIVVLDKYGNEQQVSIYKTMDELPVLAELKPFDDVVFEGLNGFVKGSSSEGTKYVTLKLFLTADSIRRGGKLNG